MQTARNVNVTKKTTDWNNVNWRKANRVVRNLRRRIFKATQDGNYRLVRSLQRLMMRSYSNILLSVRKVTQNNRGKNTPGVDKLVVKTPATRGSLVDALTEFIPWKPLPLKRVYIPKPNGKKRPLSIPSIIDRCLQAIVKNALEPAWESKFEGTSYGFRPGRSTHDAIEKIFNIARPHTKKKWVLDADIEGCFDNIAHEPLIKTIGNFPGRKLIYQWLKAGYIDNGGFYDTEAGVPQGGIISPLLANIALHGMEQALGIKYDHRERIAGNRAIVRYADDLVVFCETKEDTEKAKFALDEWLGKRGLKLSKEKTKITHLKEGFDFLGFNIRQYPVSNSQSGWKLLIKPSKESVQKIRDKLRHEWLKLIGHSVDVVIEKLNPIIRGQANYYRTGVSSEIFNELDKWMFQREYRYTKRTHPKKNWKWRQKHYWGKLNLDRQDNWVFGNKQTGRHLLKFSWFKIERHILVKGKSSPDDPALKEYWKQRNLAKAKNHAKSIQKIAQKQGCVCPVCGDSLFNGEEIHKHHKIPKKDGGKEVYSNYQLVHLYCHQQIHLGTT
jgi:RNA-directed DNA polymerase